MKKFIEKKVLKALEEICELGFLSEPLELENMVVETPRDPKHGDLSSNIAMVLAKSQKKAPREIAQAIVEHIDNQEGYFKNITLAGPGFINFTFTENWWQVQIYDLLKEPQNYGRSDFGAGQKVQIEFVSANPTGPLHVGHGRGAALGDALARVLSFAGYQVETEYYLNDAGKQMETLALSVYSRMEELLGETVDFSSNFYQGSYIKDLALNFIEELGETWLKNTPKEKALKYLGTQAGAKIKAGIKKDLADFKVVHSNWFSENSLYENHLVKDTLEDLKIRGHLYEKDGAKWFATSLLGDDKDRVLVKSDGEHTYFAADIAYHRDKFKRGFNLIIDILGADHHGYVPRLQALVEAFDYEREQLKVVLLQMVTLIRNGQPVSMSTRAGEFVSLREVLDEVGSDAARFIFLTRSPDSPLEFDLDLAKSTTNDNPVYYVQYSSARIHSILRQTELNHEIKSSDDLSPLIADEEIALMKQLCLFPELLLHAAKFLGPYRITTYLNSLAKLFHSYYNQHRILVADEKLAIARLNLIKAVREVIKSGLSLLGVSALETM